MTSFVKWEPCSLPSQLQGLLKVRGASGWKSQSPPMIRMNGSGLVRGASHCCFPPSSPHSVLFGLTCCLLSVPLTQPRSLALPSPPLALQRSYFTAPCEEFLYGPGLYREKGQAIKGQAWLPALWLNIDNTRRQRPGESTPRIPLRCRNPQTQGPLSPFLRAGKRVWMFSLYMRPPYKNVSTGLLVL